MTINIKFCCKSEEESIFVKKMAEEWTNNSKNSQCFVITHSEGGVGISFSDVHLEKKIAKGLAKDEFMDLINCISCIL